jgi:hypothetical protein
METKVTSHVLKGLILALILIVIGLVGQFTKLYLEKWYGWISIVVFPTGILLSTYYYGQQMNGNVTFGNLFVNGFKATAVATCIVFVYTLLSVYLLFPEIVDEILDKGMEEARKQGKATEAQLQQGMELGHKIVKITLLAGSLIFNLILGVLGALIGAAIAKKNPEASPFDQ